MAHAVASGPIGDHLSERLLAMMTIEWNDYRRHTTDCELKRCLPML